MQPTNRRQFLRSAAAIAAGTTFAPNLLLGQDKALKKLNVAHPDEEAAMGDPSGWKGSITQTGELKLKPKPAPAEKR